MKEVRDFVFYMWYDEEHYNQPEPMDIYDAATNLSEYIAQGMEVPEKLTPGLYARFWNRLCRTHGYFC